MNSKSSDYSDPNRQSIVLKLEYNGGSSCLLGGDTDYKPWEEKILPAYGDNLKSDIFFAPHHGSLTFFDNPSERYYYTEHMKIIKPDMTLISVGPNANDLPDAKAIELYTKYSTGSSLGNKVFTTEDKGSMKLILKDEGKWNLSVNQ